MLIESIPLWIVDLATINHITRERGAYVEFQRISPGSRWIYVGNNSRVDVKGVGTCKLEMRRGHTLFLHNVLYAPNIRWNLVYVLALIS